MDLEKLYVESLDEKSRIAYNIAKSHLGTLFSLVKSNHYIEWRGECLPSCSPALKEEVSASPILHSDLNGKGQGKP